MQTPQEALAEVTPWHKKDLSSTKQAVRAAAGKLVAWDIYNPNSSVAYVQVFDKAAGDVTVGTTAPDYVITIPATDTARITLANGVLHANAITVAATTTPDGSTAPTTALVASLFHKA